MTGVYIRRMLLLAVPPVLLTYGLAGWLRGRAGQHAGVRLTDHAAFIEFVSTEFGEVMKRWDEYRAGSG